MSLVELRRDGHVAIVTMQRVEKRNAIDQQLTDELDAAFNTIDDDADVWAAVLTGGSLVFSAGTDLRDPPEGTERGGEYGLIRRRRSTPLIAAVEGYALGGGMELALACDLVVASGTAQFGLPEVTRGVIATSGALFRAPRALPLNIAKEMLLTGEMFGADRGYELGFVNRVTDAGKACEVAVARAHRICQNSPDSTSQTMQAVDAIVSSDDDDGWHHTDAAARRVQSSTNAAEGVSAFFERRPPYWTSPTERQR